MKPFLTSCLYFILPAMAVFISIGFMADGYTDHSYLRFTSPKQTAMILGISRAGRGLQPGIFNHTLQKEYPQLSLYNFAFSLDCSPYGEVYLDAIENKLKGTGKKGLFIVTIDPWSVIDFTNEHGDTIRHIENNDILFKVKQVTGRPNFAYLVNGYEKPYIKILTTKVATSLLNDYPEYHLREDGWLEVTQPMDSLSVQKRQQAVLNAYRKLYLPRCFISPVRIGWLVKTISFLQQYGDVYLVRLPVHPSLLAIGNELSPRFDTLIDSLARQQKVPYFNFSDSCANYTYMDGSHLSIESGTRVSEQLARLIAGYKDVH
ncbi:MAG TPA: hypothetical protein VLD19_15565 [Chitinophagaceae bacterium]|nr:hypothetical protein [Chitinophagaceae bacterium]